MVLTVEQFEKIVNKKDDFSTAKKYKEITKEDFLVKDETYLKNIEMKRLKEFILFNYVDREFTLYDIAYDFFWRNDLHLDYKFFFIRKVMKSINLEIESEIREKHIKYFNIKGGE